MSDDLGMSAGDDTVLVVEDSLIRHTQAHTGCQWRDVSGMAGFTI